MNNISADVRTSDYGKLYSRKGFWCTPLSSVNREGCECGDLLCEEPGMHPLHQVADEATNSEEEIQSFLLRTPPPNLGIVTGSSSGIYALICSKTETEAISSLEKLQSDYDLDEITAALDSPYYRAFLYRIPEDVPVLPKKLNSNTLPGISLFGEGNYVLTEPCRLEDSHGEVRWIRLSPILELPRAVLKLFVENTSFRGTPILRADILQEALREHLGEGYFHLLEYEIERGRARKIVSGRNRIFSDPLPEKDLTDLLSSLDLMYTKEVPNVFPVY
jgi:hypothetical protein